MLSLLTPPYCCCSNAILYYNNLTVDQGFAILRTAILDAEQLLHTYIQRAHAANVEMWAYDFGFFLRGSTVSVLCQSTLHPVCSHASPSSLLVACTEAH